MHQLPENIRTWQDNTGEQTSPTCFWRNGDWYRNLRHPPCFNWKYLGDIPQEFFYVLFWLFADAFVRYIFIESRDYRDKRIGAGRIASMKVEFVEDEDNSFCISQ